MPKGSFKKAIAVLAMAGLACAGSAAAQDPMSETKTGSRFSREKFDSERAARDNMAYFGQCLASYKSEEIRDYLAAPTTSKLVAVTDTRNGSRCVVRDMVAGFIDYRGSLSEAWYLKTYDEAPPATFTPAGIAPPTQEETAAAIVGANEEGRAQVVVDEFARCVSAVNPLGVDTLLRTEHGDKAEKAAIQALVPSFAPCAFEGQKLSFDEAGLRSALAFALARLALAEGVSG